MVLLLDNLNKGNDFIIVLLKEQPIFWHSCQQFLITLGTYKATLFAGALSGKTAQFQANLLRISRDTEVFVKCFQFYLSCAGISEFYWIAARADRTSHAALLQVAADLLSVCVECVKVSSQARCNHADMKTQLNGVKF